MYIVKTLASDIHTTATFRHTAHSDIHTTATFTPTGTPCSTGGTRCDARNSDLTFICRDAEAKVQIQIQIP